jgi:hypothetical protein
MQITTLKKNDAPPDLAALAAEYEQAYGVRFGSLTVLPAGYLQSLHTIRRETLPASFRVASDGNGAIAKIVDALTAVANLDLLTVPMRLAYRDALEQIYRSIGIEGARDRFADALWVAPEREGRILAERLGCLSAAHTMTPIAKRMPYRGGVAVGLDGVQGSRRFSDCMIVDGAIASGATLIALIEHLKERVDRFRIYAAHSTVASLHGLAAYAALGGIDLSVNLGHASGVLNASFYAVIDGVPDRVVVGDLGDTIAGL